ncbi:MAG TPA: YwiC-like family protein [Vicinamibacterales bacterium]
MRTRTSPFSASILPREHGAYGQLAFPILTSFFVAGVSAPALLIAVGVSASFLAHEPLLVVLGRRGARARRDQHRQAVAALVAEGAVAALAGVLALVLAPANVRWSLIVPLGAASLLAMAIAIEHEKRALGEVAAALTFSSVAVPMCLAAGALPRTAFSVALAFAAIFVTATLAVRVVILRVRAGGHPRAERRTRVTVCTVSSALLVSFAWASARGAMPWATIAAAAPGLVGALWLSVRPPSPASLRRVGWTLVATSAAAAVILVVGL